MAFDQYYQKQLHKQQKDSIATLYMAITILTDTILNVCLIGRKLWQCNSYPKIGCNPNNQLTILVFKTFLK